MNRNVILSDAGFRENAQVKGYRRVAPDTLELWYNLPNVDMALVELRSLAAAMEGREVPENARTDHKTHEYDGQDLGRVQIRVMLPEADELGMWDCSNYEALH